jgi:hypothetical protein
MSFIGKWLEIEIITLSKIRQTQKDKYCMFSLICEKPKFIPQKWHQCKRQTIWVWCGNQEENKKTGDGERCI